MADWFEGWFDSKYYHILYKNRDHQEAQLFIDKLYHLLELQPENKVLDLACGKGRHAIYLNKKDVDVVGADLSAQSILHAQQYENDKLKFVVHDMREVLYEQHFDFVFNLFTSFGYFEDEKEQVKTINAIHDTLKPKGILVLDFMNVHKTIKRLVPSETKEIEGITFHLNRKVENGFIVKTISFEDEGQAYRFEERVKVITEQDFRAYVQGWDVLNVFGDYHLGAFEPETSDRFILVAQKK